MMLTNSTPENNDPIFHGNAMIMGGKGVFPTAPDIPNSGRIEPRHLMQNLLSRPGRRVDAFHSLEAK